MSTPLTPEREAEVCECGDPRCVYVKNLDTAIDGLRGLAQQQGGQS
jgi:hypothetical protein